MVNSYNVSIDANGLLTATGKASSITVTVTSASGLTDSFELKVIAKADANYNLIKEKLVVAKNEESNKVSSATFTKNTTSSSSSISYTMSDNGSTTTTTTTNSVTTSKHEILDNENY